MRAATALIAAFALTSLTGQASGQNTANEDDRAFVASAVQTMPDGGEQVGRIMKSGQNMRLEIQADGQTSIQIMRGAEGIAYLVDPQTQTYGEIRDPSVSQAVTGASNPCPSEAEMQATGLICELMGQGKVSGVVTQHWEISMPQTQGKTMVEWDTGRRRALSQTWPDGTSQVMTFQAMEQMEGRSVEHWTSATQSPGQPAALGGWWFDAGLRVVLREEIPGGIVRQLTDIKVGPVDPAMFLPPQGYTQIQPQMQQQGLPATGQ
ncbi:MAG: hypothetical protein GY945_05375 [Rhodobacteraceae bacterium]|nr:hypothetical protein [Paracoccaceae bacterium]